MELEPDFREFIELLVAHEVRFLIVGGYALAAHGLPRATGDLDAWVWADQGNGQRVVDALREFGFGSLPLTRDDFAHDDSIVQLGYPPVRIDILTSIEGVSFEDAWPHRIDVNVDGVEFCAIGLDDLITNKEAVGRHKDLGDADVLRRARDRREG